MRKIRFIFISFLFLFFITLFYLMFHDKCKTLNIFKSTSDFGSGYIKTCFSFYNIKENVRKRLVNVPILSKPVFKLYQKYFVSSEQVKKENYDFQNSSETPFIKGIISNKTKIKYESLSRDDDYEYVNWYRSHGGNWNTKFNLNKNINKNNIQKLKLVWKYSSIKSENLEKKWKGNIEVNPVFINNKIIAVTADWKIIALNAENGKLIWELQSDFMPSRRGMVIDYNKKASEENLYVAIGDVVYKVNAKNGKIIKNFGNNGFVRAFTLVAPIINKNSLVVVGKQKLLIFNKNTGKFIDQIEIHPKEINHYGGIVWGGAAFDKAREIVYVNTGNPRPQLLGSSRPGNNKRSNSIVAIDLNKKKVIWDFQETSHDLWDFDIGSPPIIHNLKIGENIYEVVIVVTKVGNTLILERNTGKPIFDITYRRAPKSKNVDENTSPFQIYLKNPERISKTEYGLEDINKLSEGKKSEIKDRLKESNYGWFEPPSFKKDLISFGLHGGASWPGAAIDPANQHLFVPVNNIPWVLRNLIFSTEINTSFPEKINDYHKIYMDNCSGCHGKKRNGLRVKKGEKLIKKVPSLVGYYTPSGKKNSFTSLQTINEKHKNLNLNSVEFKKLQELFKWWDKKLSENDEIEFSSIWYQFLTKDGLPASNPPWGYIAKLDLVSGKILYKSPIGNININGENKKIGTTNYGGLALNGAEILFFTGTEDSLAYAIDANSGEELWSYKMNAAGSAPPIIFNSKGKQYVSFISTGGWFHNFKNKDSTIYTFSVSD